jgi:hypothetical protein
MNFHLTALVSSPAALLRVPLFLVLFLVVRGTPWLLLYRRDLPCHQRTPLALFSATALPLVVVITTIGVAEGRMRPGNATALVGAGMLSVLLYPMIARLLLARAPAAPEPGIAANGPTSADGRLGEEPNGLPGRLSPGVGAVDRVLADGDASGDDPGWTGARSRALARAACVGVRRGALGSVWSAPDQGVGADLIGVSFAAAGRPPLRGVCGRPPTLAPTRCPRLGGVATDLSGLGQVHPKTAA